MASPLIPEANQAVYTIVRTLQDGRPEGLVVDEVIKGGSMGHGTTVPGDYDIDIVIYSRSVDPQELARNGPRRWLKIFAEHLEERNPGKLWDKEYLPHAFRFNFERKIKVDMLISPFWQRSSDLYRFLQERLSARERFNFSMSASKWQVDFFKDQPNQVKEFIRRAKAWRNKKWAGQAGKPKSYLLSVIVLRAYERAKGKGDTYIAWNTTAEVKTIVHRHQSADIYWEEYYRKQDYPSLFPQYTPRIVDPANPSNNLHETGISGPSNTKANDYGEGGGRWDNFVRFVDSLDLTKSVDEIH
uniref:2',5'-oligoadenylate synthetase n=1 Tax=Tedania ignis TaxID=278976 RepID=U5XFV4_TEDIG|nr:2',5'-oligoadenylate synthetase [Tedania ignis]